MVLVFANMKNVGIPITAFLGLLCTASIALCGSVQLLPEGWRLPSTSDYEDRLLEYHNGEPPIEAIADFDGDGETDKAVILINDRENKVDLFVF